MASYNIIRNRSILIDLPSDYTDEGWTISNGIARHDSCNSGFLKAQNINVEIGKTYSISYEVTEYTSGMIYAILGTTNGIQRKSIGVFQEQITAAGNDLHFFADGIVGIKSVIVYEYKGESSEPNSATIGFNTHHNKWVTYYSFSPEMMVKYVNEFFTFKQGKLYKHNKNYLRNHFYGALYPSKIRFICNIRPEKNKLFYTIRLDGKGDWSAPVLTTPPTDQFPKGMKSRLKKGNFKLIDGKYWADILRDILDPNFNAINNVNERNLRALFEGRMLQGSYLSIELECSSADEAKLVSAEVACWELE